MAILLPKPEYRFDRSTLLLYGLHLAVTAIDRVGNESEAAQLDLDGGSAQKGRQRAIPLNPLGLPVK